MKTRQFSVGEMMRYGFGKWLRRPWFFLRVLLTAFSIVMLPIICAFFFYLFGINDFLFWAFLLISLVLAFLMKLGFKKISLSFVNQEKPSVSDLFSVWPQFGKYLLATVLYILITLIGFFLLVIPGVMIGLRYSLYPYFILENDLSVLDAMSESAKATDGAKWDLLSFKMVTTLVNIVGLLCLGVGLFVSQPSTCVAKAFMFKRLKD